MDKWVLRGWPTKVWLCCSATKCFTIALWGSVEALVPWPGGNIQTIFARVVFANYLSSNTCVRKSVNHSFLEKCSHSTGLHWRKVFKRNTILYYLDDTLFFEFKSGFMMYSLISSRGCLSLFGDKSSGLFSSSISMLSPSLKILSS